MSNYDVIQIWNFKEKTYFFFLKMCHILTLIILPWKLTSFVKNYLLAWLNTIQLTVKFRKNPYLYGSCNSGI